MERKNKSENERVQIYGSLMTGHITTVLVPLNSVQLYKGCLESNAARNLIKFNCFTSVDTVWSLIVFWLLHWDLRVSTYFDLILRINVSLSSLFSIMSSTDYANANLKSYLQGKYTDQPNAVLWHVLWHVWYSQIKYDFPWM